MLVGLLLAGALTAPMFLYLRAHPEMQTRLDMLDGPLQAIAAGNLGPALLNVRDALLAFVWPGFGDGFLAYNIPGRPVLDVVSAVFFVIGLFVCLWRWRRPVYAFLLLWLLIGIVPSLVTGPTANTTRNLAALPAVFDCGCGSSDGLATDRRQADDGRRTTDDGSVVCHSWPVVRCLCRLGGLCLQPRLLHPLGPIGRGARGLSTHAG